MLAGGQSLIPSMNLGKKQPRVLIDINRLHDTSAAKRVGDHLAIGPLVRHRDLETVGEISLLPMALSANIRLVSLRGERTIPADEFFLGAGRTARQPDEFLAAAHIPVAPVHSGSAILELNYRHNNYALVGVAAHLVLGTDGLIEQASLIAFGTQDKRIRL